MIYIKNKFFTWEDINEIFQILIDFGKKNPGELGVVCGLLSPNGEFSMAINDYRKHSEIIVTESIYSLKNYIIFVTLEPCPSCLIELINKGISYIFYGASNKIYKTNSEIFLQNLNIFHKTKFFSGFLKNNCEKLIENFFHNRRLLI